jgi:hypothetical protein
MEAAFDGLNAGFWKNVKKLVNAEELCLIDQGRFVKPENAASKKIYQLVRTKGGEVLREGIIRRGEDEIHLDPDRDDDMTEIKKQWGEGKWRIVDRAGNPFAYTNLRDATIHFAVKKRERFQKESKIRSFSHFTANQFTTEIRFAVECERKIHQIWLDGFSARRIQEVCASIWGPGFYKWDQKDTENLQGTVIHVKKPPTKQSLQPMIHFKVTFEDEPGVKQELEVRSPRGTHINELRKVIQLPASSLNSCLPSPISHDRNHMRFGPESADIPCFVQSFPQAQRGYILPCLS